MDTYDLLARGIDVQNAPRKLPSHKTDIATMQDAGFRVDDAGPFVEVNAAAWKVLDRGAYDTICPGTHPDKPNSRAYPLPDGGWLINRYGIRAEQERPGWKDNSHGYASFRLAGPRTVIDISSPEQEIADKTSQALTQAGIYQRGGVLCEIRYNSPPPPHVLRSPDTPTIVQIPKSAIREAIATVVDFKKFCGKREKLVGCPQPGWLAENIANRGRYPVPTIEAVSTVPLFLPNGQILTTPGYDDKTGIYYAPDIHYGDVVSVQEAIATIDDVLADFPFGKSAHKSAAYGGILSLLARRAIAGRVPFHLVEGNRPGCGKGLLVDVIATIGNGAPFARMTAPEGEDEMRKRLTSVLMAGEAAILLDNLSGRLQSAVLDAALTSESWSDRLLGQNTTVRVPMNTLFFGTGNNLLLSADTCRRVCHIRLETSLEQPEQRSDCRYHPLLPHVRKHRGKLTAAALSLLHHYHAARRPDQGLKPWGSFEGWSLIRNVVVWAGMPDPAETLADLQATNDTDTPLLRLLLDGWAEAGGNMTAKEACEAAYLVAKHGQLQNPTLHAAIEEIEGRDKRQALGLTLRRYMGCRLDGRYFVRSEGRTTRWTVKHS